jgi:hypothetical protein
VGRLSAPEAVVTLGRLLVSELLLLREGLLDRAGRATGDDLRLARSLRSGLRRALELNHEGGSDPLPSLSSSLGALPVGLD